MDHAIPDLSIVEADADDHLVERNCLDPAVFRVALEVTSSDYASDLRAKLAAYAAARVPVYVVVDRRHERVHVLTDPRSHEYASHRVHAPGEPVTLPESIGAKVVLDVAAVLRLKDPRPDSPRTGRCPPLGSVVTAVRGGAEREVRGTRWRSSRSTAPSG